MSYYGRYMTVAEDTMASFNVYLTQELRDRMDRFKKEDWTKVAVEAFEKRLREMSLKNQRTSEQFELDAAIADRLFGWKLVQTDYTERTGKMPGAIPGFKDSEGTIRTLDELPRFSSDMASANDAIKEAGKSKQIWVAIIKPAAGDGTVVRGFQAGKSIQFSNAETEEEVPE